MYFTTAEAIPLSSSSTSLSPHPLVGIRFLNLFPGHPLCHDASFLSANIHALLILIIACFISAVNQNRRPATQTEAVAEFDERLWGAMMDYVTVGVDVGMTVVFRDGDFLRQDKMRRVRRLLWSRGLALHGQVPQGHIPL